MSFSTEVTEWAGQQRASEYKKKETNIFRISSPLHSSSGCLIEEKETDINSF